MGVLTKDVQVDLGQTRLLRLSDARTADAAAEVFGGLAERARALLGAGARADGELSLEYTVDARYVGQNFELPVVLPPSPGGPAEKVAQSVRAGFDAEHRRLYGYDQPEKEIEMVTLRLRASVPARTAPAKEAPSARGGEPPLAVGKRRVHFADHGGFVECPIYERESLQAGHVLRGPLIVEQMDTTTVVPPDCVCSVDRRLNLILELAGAPR